VQKDIEQEVQKEVSVHAIKMALSRYSKTQWANIWPRSFTVHNFKSVTNLVLTTCIRSPRSISLISGYMAERKKNDTCFFTMIEWVHEIDVLYDTKISEEMKTLIPQPLHILTLHNLAVISIHLSGSEIETPWIFYQVTKRLAFHGINIIQILSTYHELGVIIREEDMKKAIGVLLT
jgi:aspartokinase